MLQALDTSFLYEGIEARKIRKLSRDSTSIPVKQASQLLYLRISNMDGTKRDLRVEIEVKNMLFT